MSAPSPKPSRRRLWLRLLAILVVVAIGARLSLGLVFSRVLDGLLEPHGLACSWEDLDLSFLSGRGEVRFAKFEPLDLPGKPVAVVDYAVFDLEVAPLLAGELRLRRLEVDGVDIELEYARDGSWNLSKLAASREDAATKDAESATETAEPFDLSPPLSIEALRVQDVWLRVVDERFEPNLARSYHLDAAVSNVGDPARRMRLAATLTGEGFLDGAHIQGHADWTADRFALDSRIQVGGFKPRELAPYLAELDIQPACDAIAAQMTARVDARVLGESRNALSVHGELSDVHLSADGVEAASIDAVFVDVDSVSGRGASIPRVEVLAPRARASLQASDRLRIAGLDFPLAENERARVTRWTSFARWVRGWAEQNAPPWLSLLVRDDERAIPWSLGAFVLHAGELRLVDRRVDPPVELPVFVDEVDVRGIVHSRAREDGGAIVKASARMPGLARLVQLEGNIAPFVPTRTVDLTVTVEDIDLDAMTGYLRAAGLERTGQKGGLRLHLAGKATTDVCGVTDGELDVEETLTLDGKEASQLGRVTARDLHLDPELERVRFGDVEIRGTRIFFARDPSRRLTSFGLRTLGLATPPPEPVEARGAAPTDDRELAFPRVEIGRLAWQGNQLSFVDEAHDPPRRLFVDPLGFELTGLVVGGEPSDAAPPPARFVARASAPGMFEELELRGTIATKPGRIDLDADVAIAAKGLTGPLLAPIGIPRALERGELALRARVAVRRDGGWRGAVELSDGRIVDGDTDLVRLRSLRIDDVVATDDAVSIGRIALVEPFARLERIAGDFAETTTTAQPAESSASSKPMQLSVGDISVERARVAWRDATFEPPIETELSLDANVKDFGTRGDRCRFSARAAMEGTVDALELEGAFEPSRIEATIDARGIRAGPAARMLPPGIAIDCADGRVSTRVEGEIESSESGGLRARFSASDLALRDGSAEPWLACRAASVEIPRFDAAAGVLSIGPVSIEGASIAARHDDHGVLHALGLRFESVEPPPQSEPEHAPSGARLSRVELVGPIAIEVERFAYRDARRGADARALEGAIGARVDAPCTVYDDSPSATTPIAWNIDGSIAGLVDSWRVGGTVQPFAEEPSLALQLVASGVRTQGIVELAPALAPKMRGDVDGGTLEGRIDVTLDVRRTARADSWLGQPFGAEARLEGLAFRESPSGAVLAGVDSIAVEVERVDRSRGLVHVKLVDVQHPRGEARWNGTELSIAGLAVSTTAPAGEPPAALSVEPAAAAPESESELRIDRCLVTGVTARLHDETLSPEIVHSLGGLDVEVHGVSTRSKSPVRFHAVITGAPPALAVPIEASTRALDGAAPVFEELVVSGNVTPGPQPSGWVRASLSGLELEPVVAPLARDSEVKVEDGSLDVRVDAKLGRDSTAKVQTTLVFSDLNVEEPAGGPLESTLSLPMALDAALFLLRNPAGEHRISTGFTLERGSVSKGEITLAATQAIAQVLAVALAGAPLRVLGTFVQSDEKDSRGPEALFEIEFSPGTRDLSARTRAELAELRRQFAANRNLAIEVRHELSAEDIERAEAFANPPEDECRELVTRARHRRAEILRERTQRSSEVRALLAVGAPEAGSARERMRALDRELASLEAGLEQVLDILRSNAPARARKRTRVAALELAQARLDGVQLVLRDGLEREALERIDVRSPRFEAAAPSASGRVVIRLREP